jgi:hypothetical protein
MRARPLAIVLFLAACKRGETGAEATPTPAPDPAPLTTGHPAKAHPETLADAIARTKPTMSDTVDTLSPGAEAFAAWAFAGLKWKDAAPAQDEITFALVQKDSDSARGKRLCAPGSIVEIAVATDQAAIGKLYKGLLMTQSENLIHFLTVGSTGTLVANNPARFCGIIIGKYDYHNSSNGTGHAIQMVGMFDLPENHDPLPPAATPASVPAAPRPAVQVVPVPAPARPVRRGH